LLSILLWQVNPKMILTLTASIMYWSLQRQGPYQSPGQSVSREVLLEEEEVADEEEEEEQEEDFEGGIEDNVSNLMT
jgi:plastin-1